jgi:hypothetical protein
MTFIIIITPTVVLIENIKPALSLCCVYFTMINKFNFAYFVILFSSCRTVLFNVKLFNKTSTYVEYERLFTDCEPVMVIFHDYF